MSLTDYVLDTPNVHVYENGHYVARISDFIVYSVEAEYIDAVVKEYGPCKQNLHQLCQRGHTLLCNLCKFAATKVGAIVSGQTSVKAPEKEAFEKHLPEDVSIVSLHSLHGPSINPSGQALVSLSSFHGKVSCADMASTDPYKA